MPLGKEVGLGPGHIVLDGDPMRTQAATAAPPHLRPMPIVAKRSPISATAELLLKILTGGILQVRERDIELPNIDNVRKFGGLILNSVC